MVYEFESMKEDILNTKNEALGRIMDTQSAADLEDIRIHYLGRNGELNRIIKELKNLGNEERKEIGRILNESKNSIEKAIEEKQNEIENTPSEREINFDPTIPGIKPKIGTLHLITQAIEEISEVFKKIGFTRMRYPEVEWDWFSFEALNFDPLHPARDDWETFFVDVKPHPKYGPMLLTPHTSSGQIREMQRKSPPIRMINIAKCFRRQSDASHTQMFHQFEGLVIDEHISITHLKGTLDYFAKTFFGAERKTRLRPYNFAFTEPSFEIDITCGNCKAKGFLEDGSKCKICKEGWLEIGGSGMVHPNVLKNGGIDPNKHSGFAFGLGVERVLMMKSGLEIPDLRLLYQNNLQFLRQF